ncbi:hypothetical protein OJAV_G00072550 [Oryzias javanicus]|uniref:Uncharacterized protein n=1 Tax=Oryzias javanicus TaxID=123683 RepID=A0A3S2PN51_ORYJA|nr:hypothetical protein OJAV_G00072550 [Oryzias javanicus]
MEEIHHYFHQDQWSLTSVSVLRLRPPLWIHPVTVVSKVKGFFYVPRKTPTRCEAPPAEHPSCGQTEELHEERAGWRQTCRKHLIQSCLCGFTEEHGAAHGCLYIFWRQISRY